MAFPFRQPRVKRGARFSAADPTKEMAIFDPEGVMNRINSVLRRRLSDRVEALCQTTCVLGDLETADDLLGVLVRVQERGRRKFGGERRISDDPVSRARSAIAAIRIGNRPALL